MIVGWLAAAADAGLGLVGGDPAPLAVDPVAALVDADGALVCTAVVIAPDWALTAAHCLDLDPAELWWTRDVADGPTERVSVAEVLEDPDWDGHAHDLALVRLASEAPSTWSVLADSAPAVGDVLDVVGFGAATDGGEAGTKRVATLDVEQVDPDVIWTFTPGANLCSGDSGGPLYDADGDVVGVAGFVDPTCLGGRGGSVRVDQALDFVRAHVPDPGPPPSTRPDGALEVVSASGAGCSTAPGAGGLLVALAVRRRRPSRGRNAAESR